MPWRNIWLTIWYMFPIEFRSELFSRMINFGVSISFRGRSSYHVILWRIAILQEKCSPQVEFFYTCWQIIQKKEENFSAFILRWYCSCAITIFPYAIATTKWALFLLVPSLLPFLLKAKWNLCLGIFQTILELWLGQNGFMCKTYSIQVESYQKFFQWKVCGQFSTTFSSKYQPQFQVILLQNSFTLNKSPFQASLWQNSAELSSCIWIVQYVLQHIKFLIPFCKCWVCFKTFLFEDRGCSLIIPS